MNLPVKEQPGFRLMQGQDINQIVDFVNGLASGTQEFTNIILAEDGVFAGGHITDTTIFGLREPLEIADGGTDGVTALEARTNLSTPYGVDVTMFGADPTGTLDSTVAIQNAINATATGTLVIPPGTYKRSADLTIPQRDSASGGLTIYAEGAYFPDSYSVIIDSCKRVNIIGLNAPTSDLKLQGCWWSKFEGIKMRGVIYGDAAGARFSSNYWNMFQNCLFQYVKTGTGSAEPSNAQAFFSCQFRGDATQGFPVTQAYWLQFYANQNAQNWTFNSCDASGYTTGLLYIDAADTADIELNVNQPYFDTFALKGVDRDKTRITVREGHLASDTANSNATTLSVFTHGAMDYWRNDRAAKFDATTAYNLIPNGDLYDVLSSYVGAGLPVGSAGGATITAGTGEGYSGNYLNINQALTTGNTVRLRPKAAPGKGRYTANLSIRNADGVDRTIQVGMFGKFAVVKISGTEYSPVTLTSVADVPAGTVSDILISTTDNTAFNVNVDYAGVLIGEGGTFYTPCYRPQQLNATVTYDAPSLNTITQDATQTVTVPGADFGDFVQVSFGASTLGLTISGYVSAANTVTLVIFNGTSGTVNLGNQTYRIRVHKSGYA